MTALCRMDFFDVHQHVGNLVGHIPGATKGGGTIEEDCRSRIAFMDSFGITQSALMPAHAYDAARGAADIGAINDRLLELRALAPERFPVLAATVDPRHGAHALGEIDRLRDLGVQALSFHNRFQGLPLDHGMMVRIAERMNGQGMVMMAHCYASADFEAPWRLRRLAEAFPDMPFLALDVQTSRENLDQLIATAERLPNLHLDLTSSLLGRNGLLKCLDRLEPTRLTFGTNFYSHGSRTSVPEIDLLLDTVTDAEALRLIGGDNARRLFGLPPSQEGEGKA